MATRSLSIRMSIKDNEKVLKALKSLGPAGDKALQRVQKASVKASKGLKRTDYAAIKLNKTLATLGTRFAAIVGTGAFLLYLRNAGKEALGFERAMGEVSTLMDHIAVKDLPALTQGMTALSEQFGRSRTEQAKGLYQTISAGITDAKKANELLLVANKLALGGIVTTETGIKGLASAINVWGSETFRAIDASDALFVGMKKGMITVGGLIDNMGQVAPLAKEVGISMEEVTSAMSALTLSGIPVAKTATGLRAIFAGILRPTHRAAEAAKEMGLEFNTTALRTKGLVGFLDSLKDATGSNAEKLAMLFEGVEALVPLLSLTGSQYKTLTDNMEAMNKKVGETEKAFTKMYGTTPVQLEIIQTKFSNLAQELMEHTFPAIKAVAGEMEAITDVLKVAISLTTLTVGAFATTGKATGEWIAGLIPVKRELTELGKIHKELAEIDPTITADFFTSFYKGEGKELELYKRRENLVKEYHKTVENAQKSLAINELVRLKKIADIQKEQQTGQRLAAQNAERKAKESFQKELKSILDGNKLLKLRSDGRHKEADAIEGNNKLLKLQNQFSDRLGRVLLPEEFKQIKEQYELRQELTGELEKQAEIEEAKIEAAKKQKAIDDKIEEEKKAAIKELADFWTDTWQGAVDETSRFMRDEFRDALDGNRIELKDFARFFLSLMKDTIADIAQAMIFRPIIGGMVSSITGAGGLGGIFGGGAMGGFGGMLGGGVGGFGGAGGFMGSGTSLMSMGGAGSALAFGQSQFLGNVGLKAGQALGLGRASTIALGKAGLNLPYGSVGSFGANLMGLSNQNMFVDVAASTAGSIAGSIIGNALLPGIGGIIGSTLGGFAGSALGGLFGGGGGRQQEPYQKGYVYYWTTKEGKDIYKVLTEGVSHGYDESTGRAMIKFLEQLTAITGLELKKDVGLIGTYRTGAGGAQTEAELMNMFATAFTGGIQSGRFLGVPPALERLAVTAHGKFEELEEGIAQWLLAKGQLEQSLKELTQVANDNVGPFESAIQNLDVQFDAMREQAIDLGVSLSKITTARSAQISNLRKQFDEQNRLAILMATDPYAAAMAEFEKWADFLRSDAQALGANFAYVEELIGLRRLDVIEQYGDKIVDAEKERMTLLLQGFIDELRGTTAYGIAPMEALTEAEKQFADVRETALTGNIAAIEKLPDALRRLLGVSAEAFAHGPQYWERYHFGLSTLENIIGDIPGFAAGGYHTGGLRVVGERGPELEITGPASYLTPQQMINSISPSVDLRRVEQKLDILIAAISDFRQQEAYQAVDNINVLSNIDAGVDDFVRKLDKRTAA